MRNETSAQVTVGIGFLADLWVFRRREPEVAHLSIGQEWCGFAGRTRSDLLPVSCTFELENSSLRFGPGEEGSMKRAKFSKALDSRSC